MKELKKLLICALGVTVMFGFGCDVEEECNEAGVCPDGGAGAEGGNGGTGGNAEGGAGGEGGGVEIVYDTLIIADTSEEVNMAGTAGVDICGVTADCANTSTASVALGEGEVCVAEGPGCSTNRGNPEAVLDDGSACDPASNPSDYASIGVDGVLTVTFDGSLAGCNVTVVELEGNDAEGWEAFVCDSDNLESANCLNESNAVHSEAAGGEASFGVPAE